MKGDTISIGDSVKVKEGASGWMKEHGFWAEEWGIDSIDGMTFVVVGDCTFLPGNKSHFWLGNRVVSHCAVHPMWLETNKAQANLVKCPFCQADGYDLIGLKNHLKIGWCNAFEETPIL